MAKTGRPPAAGTHPPDVVRDLSEKIYRMRLGDADVASMIEKDGDTGQALRRRAGCYDELSRCYLKVLHRLIFLAHCEGMSLEEGLKDE